MFLIVVVPALGKRPLVWRSFLAQVARQVQGQQTAQPLPLNPIRRLLVAAVRRQARALRLVTVWEQERWARPCPPPFLPWWLG
ncbi:MAG: hypothetical protein BroJett015_16020 [Chloroflexota bacterium]|nr:hypothetical protein [Chloroflexota bacterium]GIK55939.1 MAG: hypothetical protein BroJett015_16020 [Chloroflexota bacterium]